MHKTSRSCVSCATFSIALVMVVACVIVLLSQRDKTTTEEVKYSRESELEPKQHIYKKVNTSSRIETNSTHRHHHRRRQFCRKCCQTPPCWYNNHKECSKCVNKEQIELHVTRLLRRAHKKAVHQQRLRTDKNNLKQ